jgi:hypothetical protein
MKDRNALPVVACRIAGLAIFGLALSADPRSTGENILAAAQAAEETPRDELAAQIRTQGFACDKALGAKRDAKRSRPDYAVWVLRCSNATYRVSRAPDMAARVVPLR